MLSFEKLFKQGYEENSNDPLYGIIRAFEDGTKILELNVASEVVGNPTQFSTFLETAVLEAGVEYSADFREKYKTTEWQVVESF